MRLRIEPSSGVPIGRQIAEQIRSQCVVGSLEALKERTHASLEDAFLEIQQGVSNG